MKADNEFDGIGKKTTYKVPDGFFEHISERTLSKAKQRELKRRKTLMLWRTVAVAASLSAIAILGYYMYEKSKPLIKLQLKALIARDLWEMNEYYQIMDADNETLSKAIEILQTPGAYDKILK